MNPYSTEMPNIPKSEEFAAALRHHVISVWFPRCIDTKNGGFFSDFDHAWKCNQSNDKLLEFQVRQTWIAAELLQFSPNNEHLLRAVKHGFAFLRDVLWDHQYGGWYHRVSHVGEPLEAETKHVHGIAYAINTCVAVYQATNEIAALDLAHQAFDWLEQFSYDRQHGGYMGFLTRHGTVIRDQLANPLKSSTDTIGVPLGYKDVNIHGDLLEAFSYLYLVSSNPKVGTRLKEVADIISKRMSLASGSLFFLCHPDWTPVPQIMRFGYAFQAASRLLPLCDVVDAREEIIHSAKSFVECCLSYAWDHQLNGSFYAGPASLPTKIEGYDLIVRQKAWWVQFEALKTFLALSHVLENNERYLHYFKSQWCYLQHAFFDLEEGGVYCVGLDTQEVARSTLGVEFDPTQFTQKGNVWKDASHEGRSLLYCYQTLKDYFE